MNKVVKQNSISKEMTGMYCTITFKRGLQTVAEIKGAKRENSVIKLSDLTDTIECCPKCQSTDIYYISNLSKPEKERKVVCRRCSKRWMET